jgi:hypothetical protein
MSVSKCLYLPGMQADNLSLRLFRDLQKYIPTPSPCSGIAATTAAMRSCDGAIGQENKSVAVPVVS